MTRDDYRSKNSESNGREPSRRGRGGRVGAVVRHALGHLAARRAARFWHRNPPMALRALRNLSTSTGNGVSLRAWLELAVGSDEVLAEELARTALENDCSESRHAIQALVEVLGRTGRLDEAVEILADAKARGDSPWYQIVLADALIASGRIDDAVTELEAAVHDSQIERHARKRLAQLALEHGDAEEQLERFTDLVALAPDYLVYVSDHLHLIRLQLRSGEREAAAGAARRAIEIYPRNRELRTLLEHDLGGTAPGIDVRTASLDEDELGVRRFPVRMDLITPRTPLASSIAAATSDLRRPGDTIAVAESAAATAQGRIVPLELIEPGALAKVLCRFVGERAALASPEGMQAAIMDVGRTRVTAAALAGAAGKLVRRRGWFHRVAGPGVAMIDDVAACLPPHDRHIIFGPRCPDALARDLALTLDCDVAIVDANHVNGAWVVGASPGVDAAWVEAALDDNPAGNEDEQTPVVIVRPVESELDITTIEAARRVAVTA